MAKKNNLSLIDCFFAFCLVFVVLLSSFSNSFSGQADEKPIARVGAAYLYKSDLPAEMTALAGRNQNSAVNASKDDSMQIVKKYIDNWIHETLLLQHAKKNLSDDKKKFDKMVEDYKKSLVTYQYESELVKQKLDTVVSDEEIEEYYNENKANFELKDNIIKVIYVKVRKKAPKVEKVKEWYRSLDVK